MLVSMKNSALVDELVAEWANSEYEKGEQHARDGEKLQRSTG
jgi:hypothetical protein